MGWVSGERRVVANLTAALAPNNRVAVLRPLALITVRTEGSVPGRRRPESSTRHADSPRCLLRVVVTVVGERVSGGWSKPLIRGTTTPGCADLAIYVPDSSTSARPVHAPSSGDAPPPPPGGGCGGVERVVVVAG